MPFYKCSKCGRIWQYPLSECPYCIIGLDKMFANQSKVIEVSKVMIPTTRHSFVPYNACIIEDENKNKWAHKTTQDIKVGDDLSFEAKQDPKIVGVWRIKYDFIEAIERTIDLIGGINFNENSKVLILPTLISITQPYFRENTSPEFLMAILDFLLSKKVKLENIKIGSQSFGEIPIEAMADKSGLLKVCLKNNITPLDLSKLGFVKQDNLEISEEALKADVVFNLVVPKAGKAKATENSFYILKKENYLGLKYLNSDKEIAKDLQAGLPKMVNLAEAEYLQTADGLIVFLGLFLASRSFINLDMILNEIIMEKKLPEILTEMKIEEIPIAGRDIKEVQLDINRI